MNLLRRLFVLLAAGLVLAGPAAAHKASDAYLQLTATDAGTSVRLDVALRDLDLALDLDADGDGQLTWGEIKTAWPRAEAYALERVGVAGCPLQATGQALERRGDGAYAVLNMASPCVLQAEPTIRYGVLREIDATHRGIARIALRDAPAIVRVLDPAQAVPAGDAAAPEATPVVGSFVAEGIHHILIGYDHVLFLLCLMLPAVMRRTPNGWQAVPRLRDAVLPLVGVVTAFTLAHSVTLALASLQWVSIPSSVIEPAIAVTIVLAALDNFVPIFRGRRALVTFFFGLIHGFGFASVLGELNLGAAQFAWALLQFNLGLELGQLAIVALATGMLFTLRHQRAYPAWVIRGGSAAAIVVAMLWFVERTADVSLLPI